MLILSNSLSFISLTEVWFYIYATICQMTCFILIFPLFPKTGKQKWGEGTLCLTDHWSLSAASIPSDWIAHHWERIGTSTVRLSDHGRGGLGGPWKKTLRGWTWFLTQQAQPVVPRRQPLSIQQKYKPSKTKCIQTGLGIKLGKEMHSKNASTSCDRRVLQTQQIQQILISRKICSLLSLHIL